MSSSLQLESFTRYFIPSKAKKKIKKQKKKKVKMAVKGGTIICALLVAYLMANPSEAITCMDVDMCVAPCMGYLTGAQSAPSAACCEGVRKLKSLPSTTDEKRFACSCVKQAASQIAGIKDNAVKGLPAACNTPLPFPISLDFDCSTIS